MTGAATATRPETHPNAEEQSLDQLMIRYQAGDHEALSIIVARTSPMLLRFFLGPSVTRHYAEDLLQELWLRVHKARHSYRPDGPVLPWLLAIARYTRVDTYRRLRRHLTSSSAEIEDQPDRRSDPAAIHLSADLQKLVGRLPIKQRHVVLMLKVNGMTLREVAHETGTTVGAVKLRAHRAYKNLRSMINDTNRREAGSNRMPALVTSEVQSLSA